MLKFNNTIVQFGFGAVGKSFYEKLSKEVNFNENKYYVITRDKAEFDAYINLGGMAANFLTYDINKDNFSEIFSKYLNEDDLLIDFADTVGTKDILKWCIEKNVMYLNTGEADWPDNWYSIFNENTLKNEIKNSCKDIKHPIVLQHGNNPGLVSHFVKAGLEYIIKKQYRNNKELKQLLKDNKFNKIAQFLQLDMIHVNDIDLQETNYKFNDNTLVNTWCIDSFFFEMLSESTFSLGTNEKIENETKSGKYKFIDSNNSFIELNSLAIDTKIQTYYPNGKFNSFLVPHEETITISKSLEVREENETIYRPTVMFLYSPCKSAQHYFKTNKVNEYPTPDLNKPLDCEVENENGQIITRGYLYPKNTQILYKEHINSGTEYVGVLLMGKNFNPVWIGNRIESSFLFKDKKSSYWQTPTITPVSMSALSAVCWMIKNQNQGGIFFPDNITDYKYILKIAEKYISKTIFKTIDRTTLESDLNINLNNLSFKDFINNN